MKVTLLIIAVMLTSVAPALAWDCVLIQWGIKNLPKSVISNYMRSATPQQLAEGAKCLKGKRK